MASAGQIVGVHKRRARGVQPGDEGSSETTSQVALPGILGREIGRGSHARHIGVASCVDGDVEGGFTALAAQVGRIDNAGSAGIELGDEYIGDPVKSRLSSTEDGEVL